MKIANFYFILSFLFIISCSGDEIKEKINKAGDVAGRTAGEFFEGASKGIQKAFDVEVVLSGKLRDYGLETGKASVTSDSVGTDNLLLLYIIYNNGFQGALTAKVFDQNNLEMGRCTISIAGKKDEAGFVEFHFDRRTNIDSKNKLTVE